MTGAREESPRGRRSVRRPWAAIARHLACAVVLAIAALTPATAAAADRAANLLVLYSNGRLLPANIQAERGLRETFARAPERGIAVFDEFLDSPRFSGPDFERTMAAYLREKYASRPPDVVLAGGGEALAFLLANRDTLFPRARIVHMGVEARDLAALPVGDAPIVGAPVVFDFAATIDLGLRLHPDATRLVIVTGATAPDRRWEAELRAIAERLPQKVAVEFLAGLPTSDVAQRLRDLGDDAVVFTPGYFGDGAGRAYAPREAALAMVAASAAPVYGPFDPFIGTGVVGGVMPSFTAIGAGAGAAVLAVLDGVPPDAAARAAASVNTPVVDWRQLARWHIDESLLPPGTSLRLREPTLFEAHRTEVIVAVAVVLLQAALIFGLLLERRRRQLAEQSVQAQRLELAHASRLAVAGELTGSIAHEINQPLGAILSNTEAAGLMLESGTLQHDELRGILADIRRDDLRASEVIRRLRALLSRHDIERERFDVNDVARDVEAMLQGEARRRGVALHVQPARSAATVIGDPIQIQQVVINLVLNAMDASGDVAGDRRSVHVTVAHRGAGIVVEVRDSGPGIPPENLPKLFDSFFSTKRTGMGLGLSIARTLVEAHGGRIVAANGAVGAVFEVELPAADEAVAAREGATA